MTEEPFGDLTPISAGPRGLSRSDVDLSCCVSEGLGPGGRQTPGGRGAYFDDCGSAKDEKLLALLNDMAAGGRQTPAGRQAPTLLSAAAEGRGVSLRGMTRPSADSDAGGLMLPLPSAQVFEEDPVVRHGLQQCGELWCQVQAEAEVKHELQARLIGELRQIQERSQRQYQESSFLMQRLVAAKQTLAQRVRDAHGANEDLQGRLLEETERNDHLRFRISNGIRGMFSKCADISDEVAAVSDLQNSLVEELQAASESHARLQSELQKERVATWRQSTDVVMAFARGTTSANSSPQSTVHRGKLARSPRGEEVRPGAPEDAATPSASSSAGRPPRGEDVSRQLWTERSVYLKARVAGTEEQSQLEQRVRRQGQRLVELSKELALEEALWSALDSQLAEVRQWGLSAGPAAETPDGGSPRGAEGPDQDVDIAGVVRELVDLRRELAERDQASARAAAEAERCLERCEAEEAEMEVLRERLLLCEDEAPGSIVASDSYNRLRHDAETEMAALRNEERAVEARRRSYRTEVEELRNELEALFDINDRLDAELSSRSRGCLRRRRNPDSPMSEAARSRFMNSPSSASGGESGRSGAARPSSSTRRAHGPPPVPPPAPSSAAGGRRGGGRPPPPPPFQPMRRQNTGDRDMDLEAPW